ncbi:MAG: hypothetical protein IPP78_06430 [Holophagaceae bacterium]|nr:hypothetical protein [Holophagaceae bacterium]
MNISTKRLALIIAATVLSSAALMAQDTVTPKREAQVERRANRQQKRIHQGVKSGQLTPKETAHLEKREAKLDKDIAKAEADGKITKQEQSKLNKEENRNSRKIFHKKHNARTQK